MKVLRRRQQKWFVDNQEIINSSTITNLDDAILSAPQKVFFSDCDNIVLIDSYEDLIEQIQYMLVVPFRFYEAFKLTPFLYWIHKEIDIPEIEKKFGRRNMLIQWEPKTWTLLRKKISMLIGRQFLIRQDWFLEMRDEFTIKGII